MVTAKTKKVGLICWPIGHSLSPVMHNAAFGALGMDWVYLPLPVRAENLEAGVRGLQALSFEGCNVSVPYKTQIIQYLDEVDDAARQMNAVNTIKISEGKLIGSNTDPVGFVRQLTSDGVVPDDFNILVIGAGGAARAALFGLSQFKIRHITVMDTIQTQAESLVRDLSALYPTDTVDYELPSEENFKKLSNGLNLVINATPVGMFPKVDASPWPAKVKMPEDAVFFDIVYNPQETKLLSMAKAKGNKTLSGLGMLVHQGVASFEIWTGTTPPVDLMVKVCRESLS